MINAAVVITNRLPTDTGFGIRQDDGSFSQVYIPSHVMRGADMLVNHTYNVVVAENSEELRGNTPWRVTQMAVAPQPMPAPVRDKIAPIESAVAPQSLSVIDDKITALLATSLYLTTGEIATAIQTPVTATRDRLKAMFIRSEIVRADVHARPNLQRATMCLWATNIDAFIACDGEE